MRALVICAVLSVSFTVSAKADPAAAAPNVKQLTATVPKDAKSKITEHWSGNKECAPQHLVAKVTQSPENGTLTTPNENIVVPKVGTLGGKQGPCVGKTVEGLVIYFQPKPGFTGRDSFRYVRTNTEDANDKLNGLEISYTVTVR